jgi:hypothetical protein
MFTLDRVVPWGRSFDEYRRMFALTEADLQSAILCCADGPASFNAEATSRGARVVSCDPLYRLEARQIRDRIAATYSEILDQTQRNADEFVWDMIPSVEELGRVRMAAMEMFLGDYEAGKIQGRYIDAELPVLPFLDRTFQLALCSHFLFLYSGHLDESFHLASIREMCRTAVEVCIFPLLDLSGAASPYVGLAIDALRVSGYDASIEVVPYEFRRGGNQMLRIQAVEPTSGRP